MNESLKISIVYEDGAGHRRACSISSPEVGVADWAWALFNALTATCSWSRPYLASQFLIECCEPDDDPSETKAEDALYNAARAFLAEKEK